MKDNFPKSIQLALISSSCWVPAATPFHFVVARDLKNIIYISKSARKVGQWFPTSSFAIKRKMEKENEDAAFDFTYSFYTKVNPVICELFLTYGAVSKRILILQSTHLFLDPGKYKIQKSVITPRISHSPPLQSPFYCCWLWRISDHKDVDEEKEWFSNSVLVD